jgi:hypothetical protein
VLSSWACSGTVLTNPVFLGDRAARIARMRRAGMCVGLGTDGGLDNNTLSIFHEMKLAALVQKSVEADPQAISAADPGYRRGRAHRGAAARLPRTRTASPTSSLSTCPTSREGAEALRPGGSRAAPPGGRVYATVP